MLLLQEDTAALIQDAAASCLVGSQTLLSLQEEQHKDHRMIRVGTDLHLGQLSPTQGRELAPLDAQGHVPPAAATQGRCELWFPSWTKSPLKIFTNNADKVHYF